MFPLCASQTIPRKMCDLNRESGSRSLQTLMTGSAIVRGVNGKETHASHIHHYHDHPPEEEKDDALTDLTKQKNTEHQGIKAAAATCST